MLSRPFRLARVATRIISLDELVMQVQTLNSLRLIADPLCEQLLLPSRLRGRRLRFQQGYNIHRLPKRTPSDVN